MFVRECRYTYTTAHMWRSEDNFQDLVLAFRLAEAGSLVSTAALCTSDWLARDFRVILLSLPPISPQEFWDHRCVPCPALYGFWGPHRSPALGKHLSSPSLGWLGNCKQSEGDLEYVLWGCVQTVANTTPFFIWTLRSTDDPAIIPTLHTENNCVK